MRRNFLLYIALLIIPFLNAYSAEDIKILSSSTDELVLSYKPNFSGFKKLVGENGEEYLIPKINGTLLNGDQLGNYRKLGVHSLLSVPSPDSYEITDVKVLKSKQYPANLAPVPTPDTANAPNIIIRIAPEKYYQSTQHEWVKLGYAGISRNRYLANLEFYAYEFIPQKNVINVPEEIIVKIRFKTKGFTPKKLEQTYPNNVLNAGTQSDYFIPREPILTSKTGNKLQFGALNQWVKIAVANDGVYKITAAQLEGMGLNITKDKVSTIKIFGSSGEELSERVSDAFKYAMNEQEIVVNTNTDGSLKDIIFFGSGTSGFRYVNNTFVHYKNVYTNNNYYLLTFDGEDGQRANPAAEPIGEPSYYPTTYKHRIFYDEDLYNPYERGGGRTWFGQSFISLQFVNQLYNLDKSGKVDYVLGFAQKSSQYGNVYCYENGVSLGYISLAWCNPKSYIYASMAKKQYSIPASNISADDRSKLNFEFKPSPKDMGAAGYFNFYEIHYPRNFVAINNEITFDIDSSTLKKNEIAEYSINGFSDKIYGFDITNKNKPLLLPNKATTGGLFKFRDKIDSNEIYKQYFVSSSIKTPNLEPVNFANIMGDTKGADIIFIYNKAMSETAKKYKEYRESKSGLTVYLVKTEDIYTEFGSGKADPTSIRDMISWAYQNWETKPRYVVLWGDAHYDYRNIESKAINLVPTYQLLGSDTSADEDYAFATDDYYGNIQGDDPIPDIAVGRLPVDNLESSETALQKIIDYEQNPDKGMWQTQMILLADDSNTEDGPDGDVYVNDTEDFINQSVPQYMLTNKMYHAIYPTEKISSKERRKPALNKSWTTEVNTNGAVIINWMGHGNPRVWSHEEVLDRDITLPTLINSKKLFFCTAGTCEYGRYDDPSIRSGAEEMVTSKTGGAIGVIAASRISYQSYNATLTDEYYHNLFDFNTEIAEYPTFGEALQSTKMRLHGKNDIKYILLGDPSVRPNFPKYNITIDSIAGCKIKNNDSIIELKALQKIRLTGMITNPIDSSIFNSFNGTGIITMFDGDENTTVTDDDNQAYSFLGYGGALNKSSYIVKDGKFAIEFIIPKDISYSTKTGRLFLSAFENESLNSAKGFYNSFIINGTEENPDSDSKGPDVSLFLDSRQFISGDIVSSAPLLIADLYDESGINTTGMGIGHKIELWVDNNPLSIDLTKKFATSFEDSRRGTIEDILSGLTAGTHKIKIRVWDIYNNFSQAQTEFVIQDPDSPAEIFDVINYPNPFSESTIVKFNHTAFPPYDVEIAIFDQMGVLIRTLKETETTLRTSEVYWNSKDEYGNSIATGPYYFRIILKEKNKISTSYGNMYMLK